MTQEEKAKAYDEAVKRAKAAIDVAADKDLVGGVVRTILPELRESEDERIIHAIIDALYSHTNSINLLSSRGYQMEDIEAWLEKQKENIEKEYVFRPLTGTDITIAAKQAIRKADEGDRLVLAFNGAYIPVRKGVNVNKIVDIYDAFIEKQKETGIQWFKSDNVKNPDKPYIDKTGMFYTIDGRMCYASEIEKQKDQKDYNKLYEDIDKSEWFKKAYVGKSLGGDDEQKEQNPVEPSDDELRRYQDELHDFKLFATRQAKEHHISISFVHDFEWNNFCAELLSHFNEKQKPVEFTHHETNESLKDAVTHQMEDDGNIDDFVRKGIDDIALKYAMLGAEWQKEQKPVEWSEEDETRLTNILIMLKEYVIHHYSKDDVDKSVNWLENRVKFFRPQSKKEWSEDIIQKAVKEVGLTQHQIDWFKTNVFPPKQGWSEEDEILRVRTINRLETLNFHGISGKEIRESIDWLKSLRPQPKDEIYKEKDEAFKLGKHQLAIKFMNYLDENRPEGKMSLSNAECEEIDKAFKENDWERIMRYTNQYAWKPSKEQVEALEDTMTYIPEFYKPKSNLASLLRDLKKQV